MLPIDPNEALGRQVHQLLQALARSELPAAALQQMSQIIDTATSLAFSHSVVKKHAAASPANWHWNEQDLSSFMSRSPVSGKRNPIAPAMRFWRDGKEVRGETEFPPSHAGPESCAHGGMIAAVFDELLAMAAIANGAAGFTGHLHVAYHAPTPLEVPLQMHAWVERHSGRKVLCKGNILADGKIVASGEGLFIQPRKTFAGPDASTSDT